MNAHRSAGWFLALAVALLVACAAWVAAVFLAPDTAQPIGPGREAGRVVSVALAFLLAALVLVLVRRIHSAEASTQQYRELLEVAVDGILGIDAAGRVAFVGRKMTALLGHEPGELLGQPVSALLPDEARESALPRPGGVREVAARRKDGREVALECRTGPSLPPGGPLAATLLLRDVTRSRQTSELLRARDAHLRLVVEQMPAILWTTDRSLRITSTLGAGLSALKVRPEELIGMSMLECLGRDDPEATPIAAHLRAVGGESLSYEMEWKGRTFQVRVDPLRSTAEAIIGTVGILVDVTDRKQALADLRRQQRQQAAVAALGLRALAGLDLDALMSEAAHAVCQTLGAEFCEVLEFVPEEKAFHLRAGAGWSRPAAHPAADAQSHAAFTVRTGQPVIIRDFHSEERFRPSALLRDHGVVSGISTAVRGKGGSPGVLGAYTTQQRDFGRDDLHFLQAVANVIAASAERLQAEEEQDRLVAILEATPDLVASAGRDRWLSYLNRAGRRLLGIGPEQDVSHLALDDLYTSELREALPEWINLAVSRGVWSGEAALASRDGQQFPVSQALIAHPDQGGTLRFLSLIARDETERQRLEAQCRQAQKMEAVGRLAGGVAHDFNNLLTVINGYSEVLVQKLPTDQPLHDLAGEVLRAGERAAGLTRQLLAFGRKQMLAPRALNLNALVSDLERMLRRLIGEDVQLVTVLAPTVHPIWGDAGQIEQVLMNLAVNARDAMPQGGKLTISTANCVLAPEALRDRPEVRPGPYVLLTVSDTGCGMTKEVLAHLFEPFFTTKEVGKGTGLGLATVYGIVKQSGGHIEVDSEPGKGSTFRVYLPGPAKCSSPPDAESSPVDVPGGTETVLVVEDEAGVRALVCRGLKDKGYTVLQAGDGDEALAVCRQHQGPIHLLLTDAVMPRLGGGALVEAVRGLRPQMKVLFMSGFTDSTLVRHGVATGEFECLLKPFSAATLARTVREVLDSGRRASLAPVPAEPRATSKSAERRLWRRRRPRPGVTLEGRKGSLGLGPNLTEALLDVSTDGAGIVLRSSLEMGDDVELALVPPGSDGPVKVRARVVWTHRLDDGRYCAGLQFDRRLSYAEFQRLT